MSSGLTVCLMLITATQFVVTSSVSVHVLVDGSEDWSGDDESPEIQLNDDEVMNGGDDWTSSEEIQCPSYCDDNGQKHDRKYCKNAAFCCQTVGLECCSNESLQIGPEVHDNFNCSESPYWKTVLEVCVPVGSLCLVTIIALLGYQYRVPLRQFLTGSPPTDVSTRRTSQCSSVTTFSAQQSSSREDVPGDTMNVVFTIPTPPPYVSAEPPQYSDIFPASSLSLQPLTVVT